MHGAGSEGTHGPSPIFVETVTGMEMIRVVGGTFSMGDIFGVGIEGESLRHFLHIKYAKQEVNKGKTECGTC